MKVGPLTATKLQIMMLEVLEKLEKIETLLEASDAPPLPARLTKKSKEK